MKQRRSKHASRPNEGQSTTSAVKSAAKTPASTSRGAADSPPFEDTMAAIRATIARRKEEAKLQGHLASKELTKTQATTTTTQASSEGQRAQGQKQGGSNTEAPAYRKVGQQHGGTSTMAQALGQRTQGGLRKELQHKTRLPKPRSATSMDEVLWQGAQKSALAETIKEYGIAGELDEYYGSMCTVGKKLLVDRVQEKTQGMYDYRVTKARGRAVKEA